MRILKQIYRSILELAVSSTAKNTYFVSAGNVIGLGFALLFTIVSYRLLSYSDYGYLAALWAMLLLASDIADVGIGSSLSGFLPPLKDTKEKLLEFMKTAFVWQFAIASLILILSLSFAPWISEFLFHNKSTVFLIQITSVGIFTLILANFFFYTLSAREQFKQAAIVTVLNGGLRFLFLIILFLFVGASLVSAVYAQSLSFIVLIFAGLYFTKIDFLFAKFSADNLKHLISFSSFLGVARTLTAIAGRLDVLMLFALLSPSIGPVEAGIYAAASRFTAPYPLFAGSFSTVIAPRFASLTDTHHLHIFLKKVTLATLGLISSIFIFIFAAKLFLSLVLGEKSASSVPVLQVLLVAQIFFVASLPAVNLAIYYLKKPFILTLNSILQILLVVIGNLVFIPRFGRFGPAYSLILSYGITLVTTSVMTFYYFRKSQAQSLK